jgi:hypothetical protein
VAVTLYRARPFLEMMIVPIKPGVARMITNSATSFEKVGGLRSRHVASCLHGPLLHGSPYVYLVTEPSLLAVL